jgi:hypothetical protein
MPVFECNVIGVRYWGNRSPLEEAGGNRVKGWFLT